MHDKYSTLIFFFEYDIVDWFDVIVIKKEYMRINTKSKTSTW